MNDRFIYTADDLLRTLDDLLEARGGAWWDGFFADRSKPVPFFADRPDENLAEWFTDGLLAPGRVLELGCGPGRNALYLAGQGAASMPSTSRPRRSSGPGSGRGRPAPRWSSGAAPSLT